MIFFTKSNYLQLAVGIQVVREACAVQYFTQFHSSFTWPARTLTVLWHSEHRTEVCIGRHQISHSVVDHLSETSRRRNGRRKEIGDCGREERYGVSGRWVGDWRLSSSVRRVDWSHVGVVVKSRHQRQTAWYTTDNLITQPVNIQLSTCHDVLCCFLWVLLGRRHALKKCLQEKLAPDGQTHTQVFFFYKRQLAEVSSTSLLNVCRQH